MQEVFPSSVLHWNYRGFTEFPLTLVGDGAEITDIYLKENLISTLPSDIGRLERLESLYLSGNDIRELPVEIGRLLHLKCLDLSGNRLARLPDEIGALRSLKFLILDDNELSELPLRLAEIRCLRYLSACDNKLKWLPQRPVYNYHHCEFRFWRNAELTTIPYSLWYHMFRDQQTRSLNIGCLGVTKRQTRSRRRCQLKIQTGEVNWQIEAHVPPAYSNVIEADSNSPTSLLELSKRVLYESLCNAAKAVSRACVSIYADNIVNYTDNLQEKDVNGNERVDARNFEENFKEVLTILDENKEHDIKNHITVKVAPLVNKRVSEVVNKFEGTRKDVFAPADIIDKYFDYLPKHIKTDLCNGPVSRCENILCKKPVFDCVTFQFCIGKIMLIENTENAILSAVFCSKGCSDVWKQGKTNTIPWTLLNT